MGPTNPNQLKEYNDMLAKLEAEQQEDSKMLRELQEDREEPVELNSRENLLDLRVTSASFDRTALCQVLKNHDLMP